MVMQVVSTEIAEQLLDLTQTSSPPSRIVEATIREGEALALVTFTFVVDQADVDRIVGKPR